MTTPAKLIPEDIADLRIMVDVGVRHHWAAANVELGQLAMLLDAWEDREQLRSRIQTIADEANGPHPVLSTEDALTQIERALFERRQLASKAEEERDALRAEVREWLCIACNTIYPGPPTKDFGCVQCPRCKGPTGPHNQIKHRQAEQQRDALREERALLRAELMDARAVLRLIEDDITTVAALEAVRREAARITEALSIAAEKALARSKA